MTPILAGALDVATRDAVSPRRDLAVADPSTGEVFAWLPDSGSEGTRRAVERAERALPDWRATDAHTRSRFLQRLHALILQHREELARLLTAEGGKPLRDARAEVDYAASFVAWFAEEAKRAYGSEIPADCAGRRLFVLREAVGVAALITPWNAPLSMAARKIAPALAAGCTIVIKPAEATPISTLALAFLAEHAGLPPGVLNVVVGDPNPIGQVLTTHPAVRKLSFTGSTAVGKRLLAACASTVKRTSMELGGCAPFIVFEDADLPKAVDAALTAKFRASGQSCVAANHLLVAAPIHDRFVEALAMRVAAMTTGAGVDDPDIGPLISPAAAQKVRDHIADAIGRGARIVAEGTSSLTNNPRMVAPVVLCDVPAGALAMREEIFGPLLPIAAFSTEEEAIELARHPTAGLAAYVCTRDSARIWRVGTALGVGMVGVNTGLISAAHVPFGGRGESGHGREGSWHGLAEYLEEKYLCLGD